MTNTQKRCWHNNQQREFHKFYAEWFNEEIKEGCQSLCYLHCLNFTPRKSCMIVEGTFYFFYYSFAINMTRKLPWIKQELQIFYYSIRDKSWESQFFIFKHLLQNDDCHNHPNFMFANNFLDIVRESILH